MARRASKVDANQKVVATALRDAGASVQLLHAVGFGCPDILVGYRGANYLMEIKDGAKAPSARQLTSWQEKWHVDWRGHACVVTCPDEALEVLGIGVIK